MALVSRPFGANLFYFADVEFGIDAVTTTNVLSDLAGSSGAAEKESDSGWVNLPVWAVGELYLKVQMKATTSTDDPVFRAASLYLK